MLLVALKLPYRCCLVKKAEILLFSYFVRTLKFINNKPDLIRLIGVLQSDSVPTEVSITYQNLLI